MNDLQPVPLPPLPEWPQTRQPPFSKWWPVCWGAMAGLLLRLLFWGRPESAYAAMLDSFILGSPALVGAVTVYMAERKQRRSWAYYFIAPAIATLLYVVGSLLIMVEGWICAIVILPLFAVVGGLSGLLMGLVCRLTKWPRKSIVSSVAILPLITGAVEHRLPLPNLERAQQRAIFVAAPPADVWRQLIDAREIRPEEVDDAWMYRIGVPLPASGAADVRDGEHLRHIVMGKGIHFDQVATDWRENQSVTWNYRFGPDSFPPHALDDHVRVGGHYFDVGATTYSLRPSGAGTLLEIHMNYRVSTRFNWYAGPVADLLIGNFEETILRFYARRATGYRPAS
ncbi:MAG: SRPBCC domain-containing protein [Pseudomonadota bacterium]